MDTPSPSSASPLSWSSFNSEESWLPFVCPLVLWVGSYVYCQLPSHTKKLPWHDFHELHNVHNMGAIVLAGLSLYIQDDSIFNERVVILFNLSYFVLDLVDTSTRGDIPFILHALFCLVLGTYNYTSPLSRVLRMNSKAAMLELSSPWLHIAKRTRVPWHFVVFALAFTGCRIVWIPIMMQQLVQGDDSMDEKLEWTDAPLILVGLFYILNIFWWLKILRILVTGGDSKKKDNQDHKKKKA